MKYLTGNGETEKPQVKVETSKGQLTLNDSGQRMYTLSDVLHGIRLAGASLSADGNYLLAVYRTNKKGGKSETVTRITETATGKKVRPSGRMSMKSFIPTTASRGGGLVRIWPNTTCRQDCCNP